MFAGRNIPLPQGNRKWACESKVPSSTSKRFRLSTWHYGRDATTQSLLIICKLRQWGEKFKSTECKDMHLKAFAFNVIAGLSNIKMYKSRKGGSWPTHVLLLEHILFFRTHDAAFRGFIDDLNVWCAQVPIDFLKLLLLHTLIFPKTERLIMLGVFRLSLGSRFDVISEQNPLWSCRHLINPSLFFHTPTLWKRYLILRRSTGVQSTKFLILYWMTWMSKSSIWKTRNRFSTILRPDLF